MTHNYPFLDALLRSYPGSTWDYKAEWGWERYQVSGKMFADLGVPQFDPAIDRGMICGSAAMLKETKELLEAAGLTEGANSKPGEFVIERAFVD